MNQLDLKQYLISKRGHKCEECGKPATILHLHHWLMHRKAGFPILDNEHNEGLVCDRCHEGIVNGIESRMRFFEKQCKRYDMKAYIAECEEKGVYIEAWLKQ